MSPHPTAPTPSCAARALSLAALALLLALAAAPAAAQPTGFTLTVTEVLNNLNRPVGAVNAGDGSGRLFLVDQSGVIRIWTGSQVLPTPFLTRSVQCCGERGLLGLAFHPNYENNGLFYIHYSEPGTGATVISRYQVSAVNPNVADTNSEVVLLTQTQPFGNHNGGQINFGPDGFLYIALGDGGSQNDPQENGQDLGTLLGKALRIDVSSTQPPLNYAIPASNPFVGQPGVREEIWALGLRNPWRFSFDRQTGDLFIADVGQDNIEEINFLPAGAAGGTNFGWRCFEGTNAVNQPCTPVSTVTFPVMQYTHSLGCSVTGGFRYRGTQQPVLTGTYLFGDFCSGRIWGAKQGCEGGFEFRQLIDLPFNISSFGEGEDGELYVVQLDQVSPSQGKLHRVVATPTDDIFDDDFESEDLNQWHNCNP
jgi:glucose/arabinose dehydrogenase